MEPIIYVLPISDKIIKPTEFNIYFDTHPSPKLIKYGFNSVNEQLNMVELTSVPYYKVGLNFNFDENDESSISKKAADLLGTKNFDINFAEFWEILNMFSLLNTNHTIFSTHTNTIKEIVNTYEKLSKSKNKYGIDGNNINKIANASVTLVVYKYSDVNIDENAAIQFIIKDINNLLRIQAIGAHMILQLFSLQTQTSAEIIYYLSTIYTDSYLIKPTVTSDLFDVKYLVLTNLKTAAQIPIPKHPDNIYLASLGLSKIPEQLTTAIQCMNSDVIPKKYKQYSQIKEYLESKVYEGATYNEMVKSQNDNANEWLGTFTNLENMKTLMDNAIKKSTTKCINRTQLIKLLN